ncbi:luciferase-like monooxygenase family protein [Mycobacterium xenopi 3993]|nr:luciferase-like monooxygenase family protein [Mycobacterium xenopi 3993]
MGFVLSHEQFTTAQLLDQAEAAERGGFRYLWASDHIQPWQDNEGHAMFPWITLALVGQRTNHVPFGTGVTCPIFRYHPTTVAHAFASLAVLHPGRVFLGVGTGERLNEQAATTQFGSYRERHDRLVEAIQLIRRLWSGQRISFQGRYFQTNQLKIYDVPKSPPQIFVAAGGRRARSWPASTATDGSLKPTASKTRSSSPRSTRVRRPPAVTPPIWASVPRCSPWSATRTTSTTPPSYGGSPAVPSTNRTPSTFSMRPSVIRLTR